MLIAIGCSELTADLYKQWKQTYCRIILLPYSTSVQKYIKLLNKRPPPVKQTACYVALKRVIAPRNTKVTKDNGKEMLFTVQKIET